jgi:hypothetical protein
MSSTIVAGRTRRTRRHSKGLYWRRRIVALSIVGGVLAVVRPAAGAISGGAGPTTPPHPRKAVTYVIQPGDSLWTAARALAPGKDPRPVVQALEEARHGRMPQVGEVISWTP